jgi:hypothetical protein
MARSITFRGKEAVLKAYEMNGIGPWAVACQGKNICTSSGVGSLDTEEGAAQLSEFLEMMVEHGSQSQYELKVYRLRDEEEDIYITDKTPPSRSVPFALYENEAPRLSNGDNAVLAILKKMDERLAQLEERERLRLAQEDDEEEPEDKTVMGKIGTLAMGLLERPEVQQQIISGVMGFVKNLKPNMNKASTEHPELGKVAGVEQVNLLSPDQIQKAHAAMTRLSVIDAELGDHLTKLADIAENSPKKYAMALTFL